MPKSIRRDYNLIVKAIKNQDENLAEKCAHEHLMQIGERFIGYLKVRHTLDFDMDPRELRWVALEGFTPRRS